MSPQQIATLLRRQDTLVELVVGRPALAADNGKNIESKISYFLSCKIKNLIICFF
uniref:Transcriptional regulator n=1 Tax=Elaeophora elaphi TaxID=1147741 RepID=A0A0R3RMR8_9BILA